MAKLVEGQEKGSHYTIAVRSHLEHGDSPWYPDHVFAISGGGANSCILGQHDKVLDFEDRGELMVFHIHPLDDGNEDRYDIITLPSPGQWVLNLFRDRGAPLPLDEDKQHPPSNIHGDSTNVCNDTSSASYPTHCPEWGENKSVKGSRHRKILATPMDSYDEMEPRPHQRESVARYDIITLPSPGQ